MTPSFGLCPLRASGAGEHRALLSHGGKGASPRIEVRGEAVEGR
jgi:hypothetical protein